MIEFGKWQDALTGEEQRELSFAVSWIQAHLPKVDPVHRGKAAEERQRAGELLYTYLKSRGWRLVRFDHPESKATDRISELESQVKDLANRPPMEMHPEYQRLVHMVQSMLGRVERARRFAGGHADATKTRLDMFQQRLRALEASLDALVAAEDRDAKSIQQIATAVKGMGEHFYAHQHVEAPGELDLDKLADEVKAASEPAPIPAMASPEAVAQGCACAPRTLQRGCPVHEPVVTFNPPNPSDWFNRDRVHIDTGEAMDSDGKVFRMDPATGRWGWR